MARVAQLIAYLIAGRRMAARCARWRYRHPVDRSRSWSVAGASQTVIVELGRRRRLNYTVHLVLGLPQHRRGLRAGARVLVGRLPIGGRDRLSDRVAAALLLLLGRGLHGRGLLVTVLSRCGVKLDLGGGW